MNLAALAEPFPAEDIEHRVSHAGITNGRLHCQCLAYVTARAVQERLDMVCGPENWRLESPQILDVNGKSCFACGLSIRIGDEWITKWDVSEPTQFEPAKGGWSTAMKRSATQWGIARYLYYLPERWAEVSETKVKEWIRGRLPKQYGGQEFWWNPPELPGWALPKDPDVEVSSKQLSQLVLAFRDKFTSDITDSKQRRDKFTRFVHSVVGEFPVADHKCWTADALAKCRERIEKTSLADGVDSDVPFE